MGVIQLSAAAYARMQKSLLPPSKMWRLDQDSVLSKVLLAAGDELARVSGRGADLVRESDPRTTDELLPEFEKQFELVAPPPVAIPGMTHSLELDSASSQYAEGGEGPALSTKATWEAWVKFDDATDGTRTITSQWGPSGSRSWRVEVIKASMTIRLWISISMDGVNETRLFSIISDIFDGAWHHLAVSFDGAQAATVDRFEGYVDGVLIAFFVNIGSANAIFDGAEPLRIGASTAGINLFDGWLADVRLWNVVRSAGEIADNWKSDVDPSAAGLLGLWCKNDDLVGGALKDHTVMANHLTPKGTPTPPFNTDTPYDSPDPLDPRRSLVVGRLVRRQRYRPVDFQQALAAILGQEATAVVVIERTRADAIAMADDREIYRFFIYRNPVLAGEYDVVGAQQLVDEMKPTHTKGHVIESNDFLCDDEFSLCDRDILGV